ncbi:MAG TPA: cytoplasmic protein [Chloroflexota bacterium]|nr:cytoplasmic protein [Chloroflexota bacterium]
MAVDHAPHPSELIPDSFRVILENDRVRVVEARLEPGQETPLHWHEDRVGVALTTFTARSEAKDGQVREMSLQAGHAIWFPEVEHKEKNVGSTTQHVILVELKEPKR